MKRILSLAVAGLIATAGLAPATIEAADSYNMRSGQAVKMDRSGTLSELAAMTIEPSAPTVSTREIPNILVPPRLQGVANVDAPYTLGALSPIVGPRAPARSLSFGGYDSDDNDTLFGSRLAPPDTEGDVGLEHYVQWNNLGFKIFDKAGNLLNGPNGSAGNLPWAGFSGSCETENDGDPIVLYDHVAGRWLFSQFDVGPGLQCVAISDGEDPAGPYTRFAFAISLAGFNDYPKIGLWTSADGSQSAYHITTNEFNGDFLGVNMTALDRDAMLAAAGDPVAGLPTFVQFTIPPAAGTDPFAIGLQAGHLEGPILPPAGTCETYIQAYDSETFGAAGGTDGYRTWNFCVDFVTPANSTLTENALIPAGFEFDSNMCDFGPCVPQPNGQLLDAIGQFTMYRFAVRDVGGSLSGAISHTVDLGGDLGGVQWAQFDMSGAVPALADIGQLDVGDGLHRWMPSISQDQEGNIAIGYSRSGAGPTDFPSVYYTGREAGAAPGALQPEAVCINGTGSQSGTDRWGDYSTVSIDPADDCTFWVTNEYVETTGIFQWDTQVCAFRFPNCGGVCEPNESVEETCNDGVDNDCDTFVDCDDSDCADGFVCTCEPVPEICDDGIDNDCDTFTDCDDNDCSADPVCLPPGPDNDFCDDAIPVECDTTISGTTISASLDDAGFCGTANTAPGVWYSVAHTGPITASTCNQADYDTKLSAYNGECGDLGCIDGNDDTAGCGLTTELTWDSDGAEDLILVHGFGAGTGNFDLTVTCEEPPETPENDLCSAAIPLECGDTISGSTVGATFDNVGTCGGTSNSAPGVWYSVNADGDDITASTCNQADYDTKLSVFDGECGVLGCIGGNDDGPGCSGFTSEVEWASTGGDQLILVHGFGTTVGDFDLTVTCEEPPEPPENDICEDADGPLVAGDIVSGTTIAATADEPPDIDCGTNVTAPGVWYDVIGTGNTMTASTCNDGDPSTGGADYDTKLSVYCADCEVKECIGGQDDDSADCSGFTTKFDWPTQEGATYKVFVHGFGSGTGDFDLAILDDGVAYEGPLNDCDGISADQDLCPDTFVPESVPTRGRLNPNQSALMEIGGVFTTAPPNDAGMVYTTEDTAGCSCEQIVDQLGAGGGQLKKGCSYSLMDEWVEYVSTFSFCGDCLEANGTPGCENGDCEAAVCAVDSFCCDFLWDGICAGEAEVICGDGDICTVLGESVGPLSVEGGRMFTPELISKDPNYTPKE